MRDYFAAAIVTGLFSRPGIRAGDYAERITLADYVFDMADAMLERRKARRYKSSAEMKADMAEEQ